MRAYSKPMLVSDLGQASEQCWALERLPLGARGQGAFYDERWLQMLIQRHPTLLPVEQIEAALTPLAPVCVELPTPSGFADNLLLTPDGGVVLVETKLWRNAEARREVVGQVLDYAKDLSRWSYEDLERAIRIARKEPGFSLFAEVCGPESAAEDEARFVDAVSRNLRLGRFLLIIAGDGIQESAEQLADFLQRHVGLHFTLALVEIGLWRAPLSGQVFVQPKVITRTVQIERAVVRLEAGVELEPARIVPASPSGRPTTISAETFFETLKAVSPSLPERLQAFLSQAEPLGVYGDVKRAMTLKWPSPEGQVFRLGHIDQDGRLATDHCHADAQAIGRIDLSHAYQARLAKLIPGAGVRQTPNPRGWRVVVGEQNPPLAALLDRSADWLAAIADYQVALMAASELAQA